VNVGDGVIELDDAEDEAGGCAGAGV